MVARGGHHESKIIARARADMTLDIGCGKTPKGNVNVDLYQGFEHREKVIIIKADAHHLPFRSNVFDKVISHEVIEHIENPLTLLREMHRVSRDKIMITTPNAFYINKILRLFIRGFYTPNKEHIYLWGPIELETVLIKLGFRDVRIGYLDKGPGTGRLELFCKILRRVRTPFKRSLSAIASIRSSNP